MAASGKFTLHHIGHFQDEEGVRTWLEGGEDWGGWGWWDPNRDGPQGSTHRTLLLPQ